MDWYDDRQKNLTHEREPTKNTTLYETPQQIYDYLNSRIHKQDEAKKAAAMLIWKMKNKIRQNIIFCGPTGCGKTEIWRQLNYIFPQIYIHDVSNLTCDGWKGGFKWSDVLRPVVSRMEHSIIVLDEADKMISPKFTSGGENVAQSVMSEGLKILEGSMMQLKDGKDQSYCVDTRKISFVLCGAFSNLADDLAAKGKSASIGFGSSREDIKPYSEPLTMQDIIDYGMTPEFAGRIQQIVNLEPMLLEDYEQLLSGNSHTPIQNLEQIYHRRICLSQEKRQEIAKNAYDSGLGVREIINQITRLVDAELFREPEQIYVEL